MKLRAALTAALIAAGYPGCTSLPTDATPAPSPVNEAPRSKQAAALTDWREALAQTLDAQERGAWDDVALTTSWVWPQFGDYRLYYRARAEEYAMRFTDAAQLYARVVSETPQSIFADDARERYFLMTAASGDTRAVIAEARQWAQRASGGAGLARRSFVLGRVFEAAGDVTAAAGAYRQIRIDYPAAAAASEAEARLAGLNAAGLDIEPLSYAERKRRAGALFNARAYDLAYEVYGDLLGGLERGADRQEFMLRRGLSRFYRRAYDDAKTWFAKARAENPKSELGVQAYYYQAFAKSRLGDADGALRIYQSITKTERKRFPNWAADALFKTALIHIQEGDDKAAALHFTRYLDEYPKGDARAEAYWWLAWANYHLGAYEKASQAFAKRAEFGDEAGKAARYWMARCQEKLGKPEEARASMLAIATAMPLHYYGLLAAARSPDPVTTAPPRVPFFAEGANVRPSGPTEFHMHRGETLAEIGRFNPAEKEFQAAAQAAGSRDEIFMLAGALVDLGRYNAAQRMVWSAFEPELLRADVFYTDLWSLAYPRAFAAIVNAKAGEQKTDPNIVLALMREESRYRPDVVSPAQAYGLLQLILPTAKRVAGKLGMPTPTTQDLADPELNITLGTAYIRSLIVAYRNNYFLAFAGYNGGPLNVNRWLQRRPGLDLDEFVETIPYTETRNYVKKVTTSLLRYRYLYEPERRLALPFLTASVAAEDGAQGVE